MTKTQLENFSLVLANALTELSLHYGVTLDGKVNKIELTPYRALQLKTELQKAWGWSNEELKAARRVAVEHSARPYPALACASCEAAGRDSQDGRNKGS